MSSRRTGLATTGLVAITFVWGATFVVIAEAVDRLPVWSFNALRFTIATVALAAVTGPRLASLGRDGWRDGALLGVAMWAGYATQTFGLTLTTPAKAAFITGMFVVFTPLLQALVVRRAPTATAWLSATVAFAGLGLLTLQGSLLPAVGDVLVVGTAVAFALHIVGLGVWSAGRSAAALATVQLGVSALLHTAGGLVESVVTEGPYAWWPDDAYTWGALVFTAVFASAIAFTVQTAAQAVLSPTRTAVVLTMEPVFAAVTEWVGVPLLTAVGVTGLVASTFGVREGVGAGLILAAMLWSELGTDEPPDALAGPETGTVHPVQAAGAASPADPSAPSSGG